MVCVGDVCFCVCVVVVHLHSPDPWRASCSQHPDPHFDRSRAPLYPKQPTLQKPNPHFAGFVVHLPCPLEPSFAKALFRRVWFLRTTRESLNPQQSNQIFGGLRSLASPRPDVIASCQITILAGLVLVPLSRPSQPHASQVTILAVFVHVPR